MPTENTKISRKRSKTKWRGSPSPNEVSKTVEAREGVYDTKVVGCLRGGKIFKNKTHNYLSSVFLVARFYGIKTSPPGVSGCMDEWLDQWMNPSIHQWSIDRSIHRSTDPSMIHPSIHDPYIDPSITTWMDSWVDGWMVLASVPHDWSIHSSIHPSIHPTVHALIHSPILPFIHSFIDPLIHWIVRSSIDPLIHWSNHCSVDPFIHSFIHWPNYKLPLMSWRGIAKHMVYIGKYSSDDLCIIVWRPLHNSWTTSRNTRGTHL